MVLAVVAAERYWLDRRSASRRLILLSVPSVTYPDYSPAIITDAGVYIEVVLGEGDHALLSGAAANEVVTIVEPGVYDLLWVALVTSSVDRAIPVMNIYDNADTIGTDTPLAKMIGHYHRVSGANQPVDGQGIIAVTEANQEIKFATSVFLAGQGSGIPAFEVLGTSNEVWFFKRGSGAGLQVRRA